MTSSVRLHAYRVELMRHGASPYEACKAPWGGSYGYRRGAKDIRGASCLNKKGEFEAFATAKRLQLCRPEQRKKTRSVLKVISIISQKKSRLR